MKQIPNRWSSESIAEGLARRPEGESQLVRAMPNRDRGRLTVNLLSASRIALCLPLLLVDAMTLPFWVLYLIAGLTDILDGFLARRWEVESKFGARLDSLADFVFVLAVGYKLFPWLKLPVVLWIMIGLIALVKASNAFSVYLVKQRIEFLHTKANKLTGFLLFIGMMTIGQSYFIPVAWVIACVALFAAIQEGHLIRKRIK